MKISDLIPRLHRMWEEHGDLDVRAYDYSDITPSVVETPEVESNKQGETYVLLRP
ncbi:hypothetical protein J7E96_19435 [Streptomyces sp. ISL-96]|uniref:hypothetical protein n=1 Tax=Streptomyces sp. ISL-96 TaxID=2819191 RepID=UPI001BECFE74|nr:hypothetical protein [Streptomyces sp. ISL-96]MBT2490648.1 hypothetical protein [Streptomyces sp. ISL-96]